MSRELDAEIAEKVMGYHRSETSALPDYLVPPYEPENSRGEIRRIPHYSTSIEAAWEVVEKMAEKTSFDMTHYRKTPRLDAFYSVSFGSAPNRYCGQAETAPLAICKAALKTISSKKTA